MKFFLALGAVQALTACVAAHKGCTDVAIPVTVAPTPVPFPKEVNLKTLSTYANLQLGYILNTVSKGEYTIKGTFCKSSVPSVNNGHVQVLVHGILGSRYYWSGLNPPSLALEQFGGTNYSYVDYTLSQGFDTLAIDRLGNGQSSLPSPFAIHLPAQVEAMNSFLNKVRAGVLGTTPKELIWVGHSWGSILGAWLVAKYPNAVERLVLTGWTAFVRKSSITALRALAPWPARLANPKRFPDHQLGYVHPTNQLGSEALNFWAEKGIRGHYYDPLITQRIWSVIGTVAVSELLSPGLFNGLPAPAFHGEVLVVTGKHDEFFCAQSYLPGHADCGVGGTDGKGGSWGDLKDDTTFLGETGTKVFPNAKRYDYYVPPNTGHALNAHYSQKTTYDTIAAWLKETANALDVVVEEAAAPEPVAEVVRDEL